LAIRTALTQSLKKLNVTGTGMQLAITVFYMQIAEVCCQEVPVLVLVKK
jgi:hypothetical protein